MALRYKEALGAAIRRRRDELGLTQKDVAEAAHVKEPQTISRWERGETAPSDLEAVARALKMTIPELMAGIQPPSRRVARKLDIAPQGGEQLDRIESKLEEIYALLSGSDEADARKRRDAAAAVSARLVRAAQSPPPAAPEQPQTRPAKRRRSGA